MLYPTGTLWGLGGRAADGASALRIAQLKGRARLPLIVLVNRAPAGLPPLAARLAEALWPGPVTLVVPAEALPGVAPEVLAPDGTVGLRWTPHPVAQALVAAVGPLTSTSANAHGHPPVKRPEDLTLPVDAVAPGACWGEAPSTILHGVTGAILRPGAADADVQRLLQEISPTR